MPELTETKKSQSRVNAAIAANTKQQQQSTNNNGTNRDFNMLDDNTLATLEQKQAAEIKAIEAKLQAAQALLANKKLVQEQIEATRNRRKALANELNAKRTELSQIDTQLKSARERQNELLLALAELDGSSVQPTIREEGNNNNSPVVTRDASPIPAEMIGQLAHNEVTPTKASETALAAHTNTIASNYPEQLDEEASQEGNEGAASFWQNDTDSDVDDTENELVSEADYFPTLAENEALPTIAARPTSNNPASPKAKAVVPPIPNNNSKKKKKNLSQANNRSHQAVVNGVNGSEPPAQVTNLPISKIVGFTLLAVAVLFLILFLLFTFVFSQGNGNNSGPTKQAAAAAAAAVVPTQQTGGTANNATTTTVTTNLATVTPLTANSQTPSTENDGLVDIYVPTATAVDSASNQQQADTTASDTLTTTNSNVAITNTQTTSIVVVPTATPKPLTYPVKVTIQRLGIDTKVQQAAIQNAEDGSKNPDGTPVKQWAIPDFAAAHHTDSADCGQTGEAILAGHNWWARQHGVFYALFQSKQGDLIECYSSTGQVYTYMVESQTVHGPKDISWYTPPATDAFADSHPNTVKGHYLVLYTCTSDFVDRIVVRAVQVNSSSQNS